MRYYVYISDSKLEMLYEQVPMRNRESIAAELNINFGLIQTKFQSETVANARHQKIQMVQKYLGKKVGSIGDGKPYAHGVAKVAWGPLEEYPEVVYFGGNSNSCQLALVGSYGNCVGVSSSGSPNGYSSSSYIVGLLARRHALPNNRYAKLTSLSADELQEHARSAVAEANICSIVPNTTIEFLARTSVRPQSPNGSGECVYIGSPIFIAERDHEI